MFENFVSVYVPRTKSWFDVPTINMPILIPFERAEVSHCVKSVKYEVFSGPYLPTLRLNTERYSVFLHLQSECGKIRTREKSVFGHFSRNFIWGCFFPVSILKNCVFLLNLLPINLYLKVHLGLWCIPEVMSKRKRYC